MDAQPQIPLNAIVDIMAVAMVLIALGIVSVGAIRLMIKLYRLQSLTLAALTILVARTPDKYEWSTSALLILFALLIPGMLAYIVEPLLAQATARRRLRWPARLATPFLRHVSSHYREEAERSLRQALPIWLDHDLSPIRQRVSILCSLVLTLVAYVLAFNVLKDPQEAQSLAVSITLLMLGMFTMINREDLISQIMGLLVMDHGLFLAAVLVMPWPSLLPYFVISLFLYILITLVILVILLPELHEASATIEVTDQRELRG
ncbi:MAG: hypothetical protein GWN58_56140 [Anaerolineae bacterium]|nr:hypothetical protein [Anaerolineae bacterium]